MSVRALLAGLALALACTGCGLFERADPIGFRTYTLEDCTLDEGISVVRDVTKSFALARFGGVGLTWDPELGNLALDPVYDGPRRMKLYIHVQAAGEDVDVDIFALVETLAGGGTKGVGWINPMQDVPLQEELFRQCVAELLARREKER